MSPVTLQQVKGALTTAWDMWREQDPDAFKATLGSDRVNIIFDNRRGGHFAFGIPNLYRLAAEDIPKLRRWWEARRPGARLLPVQQKVLGVMGVNAVYRDIISFDFHIPVEAPKPVGAVVASLAVA